MELAFTKMNGAGNDFVLIDNRQGEVSLTPAQVARLCDRHRGIGADGLMLLIRCSSGKADWAWDFYNNDGSAAEMCGNGARCFARFIQRLTGVKNEISFATTAGVITARFQGDLVTINLTAPRDIRLGQWLSLRGGKAELHSLDTGVPHAVMFVPNADEAMVQETGKEIRRHPHFAPRGANVNFAQILGPGAIRVRTYERGVEGETLACGTGVTASALAAAALHGFGSPVRVRVQGGDELQVGFVKQGETFSGVTLTGPADFVFDGRISL